MNQNPFDYEPEPLEPERPSRRGCWFALSLLLIVALLASSITAIVWFVNRSRIRAEGEPVVVESSEIEVETAEPEPVETAVPTENSTIPGSDILTPTDAVDTAITVNRIAYINEENQVVTIDPDGRNERVLTDSVQRFIFPAWSPDGMHIAAIGSDRIGAAIYVVQDDEAAVAASGNPASVYAEPNEAPFYLYWSPDGKQISFLANHPDDEIALHLVAADGSGDSRIVSTGAPLYWDWASDSSQLLIHTGTAVNGRIEMIDALSGSEGDSFATPGLFQAPGISADGRFWAYAERRGQNSRLVVVDTVTGAEQNERHAGLVAMSWSPTGNMLAFTSPDSPERNDFVGPLRLLDADTGEVELLSKDAVVAFFWSPNGRYLAAIIFRSELQDGEINASLAPDAKSSRVKPARQFNIPPLELFVFDVQTREGRFLEKFDPTFNFVSQFLPYFDQYALSHSIWSPGSDAVVLPMRVNRVNRIVVIPINGGGSRTLGVGSMPFWSQN